jgi:hypothetical protein
VNDEASDQVILSMLTAYGGHWKKVAMVIGRVADTRGSDRPEGEEGYYLIARRIETLVAEGHVLGYFSSDLN